MSQFKDLCVQILPIQHTHAYIQNRDREQGYVIKEYEKLEIWIENKTKKVCIERLGFARGERMKWDYSSKQRQCEREIVSLQGVFLEKYQTLSSSVETP